MVTPIIVKRNAPGVSEGLPSLVEPFLGPPSKTAAAARRVYRLAALPAEDEGSAPAPAATRWPRRRLARRRPPSPAPLPSRPVSDQRQQPAAPNTQELLRQLALPVREQPQPAPADAAPPASRSSRSRSSS